MPKKKTDDAMVIRDGSGFPISSKETITVEGVVSMEESNTTGTPRRTMSFPMPNKKSLVIREDDPFEAVLIGMVETNRRKRADYAKDSDPFSNFKATASFLNVPPYMAALFNCQQKLARVSALTTNARTNKPQNEALEDTLLDNAVYAVIALAIYRHG